MENTLVLDGAAAVCLTYSKIKHPAATGIACYLCCATLLESLEKVFIRPWECDITAGIHNHRHRLRQRAQFRRLFASACHCRDECGASASNVEPAVWGL